MHSPDYWHQALDYLRQRDNVFAQLVADLGAVGGLQSKGSAWTTLARAIVSQQISVSAADAIWARVSQLLDCNDSSAFARADPAELRRCGLSGRKVEYLQSTALWCARQDGDYLRTGDWQQVRADLMALRGIGAWTCQMFAMFYRLEPDEFPLADIGLQRALLKIYQIDVKCAEHQARLDELSQLWRPYRSVVTWYLWRAIDPVPVAY